MPTLEIGPVIEPSTGPGLCMWCGRTLDPYGPAANPDREFFCEDETAVFLLHACAVCASILTNACAGKRVTMDVEVWHVSDDQLHFAPFTIEAIRKAAGDTPPGRKGTRSKWLLSGAIMTMRRSVVPPVFFDDDNDWVMPDP